MRVVFIGAGSVVFTRNLTRDILTFPELQDSEIVLMDIDADRLSRASKLVSRMAETAGSPVRVFATTDRRQALKGADYVVITIQVGGNDQWEADIRIPERYGVSQCVGDTIGPGGIFRGLRHLAVFDGLIEDMAELCPKALVLQYSNPMAILTWRTALSELRIVGLCHSVQHGAPPRRVLRGTTRRAHLLGGRDQPPGLVPHAGAPGHRPLPPPALTARQLRGARLGARAVRADAQVRLLRDRVERARVRVPALLPQAARPSRLFGGDLRVGRVRLLGVVRLRTDGRLLRQHAAQRAGYEQEVARQIAGTEPIELERSDEYGALIIQAVETGSPVRINGNVPNEDLITNLPAGACVEVPCLVDQGGVHPCVVGALPPQLASLNRSNIAVQELVVKGHLERDRGAIYQAMALDPLPPRSVPWTRYGS